MDNDFKPLTTGLPGLDRVLQGLLPGDNVVWEVEDVEDFTPWVKPLNRAVHRSGRKLVYFRFGTHAPLLFESDGPEVVRLDAAAGFEQFINAIIDTVDRTERGTHFVFDSLSGLATDWLSDRMVGNFFMIAAPHLHEHGGVAYFTLLKNRHSFQATDRIDRTAQIVLEVHRRNEQYFVHPKKVEQRHSPTLYLIHAWEGEVFRPVTDSATITDIVKSLANPWLDFTVHRTGIWTRTFREAQRLLELMQGGLKRPAEVEAFTHRLIHMVATRDERMKRLAREFLTLADLVETMKRLVGTGLIGGKSLGVLLARGILRKRDPHWEERLENHDSFFIGSDVFYNYLVENGCWWLRRRQKDFDAYLAHAEEARQKILRGKFPDTVEERFREMLEYFGQSPIIVRSSSLLEDSYGNAFSGKYESVFLVNQGTPEQRLEAFRHAVRTVYASALGRESLMYRRDHGLLERDEQMALLVQRVSGAIYGPLYFPQLAGAGFSFNPFVWHEDIDPRAGVIRVVLGLGTRAVERTEDDYTRLVALNAPLKRPETRGTEDVGYRQRRADVLSLAGNKIVTLDLDSVVPFLPAKLRELILEENNPGGSSESSGRTPTLLNFDRLLAETDFAAHMREMLQTLEAAYGVPVDIEFTAFVAGGGCCRINLLQCRPFQVKIKGEGSRVRLPADLPAERVLVESRGPIVGQSMATVIDRVIYVVPAEYSRLGMSQRYTVARTVGRLTHLHSGLEERPTIMLIGPGRWGTSMPAFGVPVSFAEISTASVICELALMHEGLVPDVSLGTHFFNDLVEMGMLCFGVSPGKAGHVLNEMLLASLPNRLAELLPGAANLASAIRVIDASPPGERGELCFNVDSVQQRAVCYFGRK